MGIRIKNLHNYNVALTYNQTLTVTTSKAIAKVHFDGFISNVIAKLATAGTGVTSTILDVMLNGATIFAAATKITLAATTGTATYSALTSTPMGVTAGSILSLDVTQIATAPINAIVELTISKTPVYSPSNNSDRNLDL